MTLPLQEEYILNILDKKINMFELVIGEIDNILGNLDEEREFSDIVMDIWARSRTREESRIRATQIELNKKVRDQHKRYGLKVQVDLINALRLVIPVVCMEYEVYRKRAKRDLMITWNPLIKDLEIPVCECCNSEAGGFSLCDDRLHLLCAKCCDACPICGKHYCRICHPRACPRCSSGVL